MVNQYSEITFIVSKVLKRSVVSKRIVNYLEEQLQTFPLAGVTFGAVTSCYFDNFTTVIAVIHKV